MTPNELCALAAEAMQHAYVPYSGYKVGACLLAEDGRMFTGCNVEFSRFGDSDTVEQVEYEYVIDSEGCFKLSLKESAGQ